MRRYVPADVNRLFAESPAKLGDVCNGNMVQSPERILVEGPGPLFQSDFNAVSKQVILSKQILLLDLIIQYFVFALQNQHNKAGSLAFLASNSDSPRSLPHRLFGDAGIRGSIAVSKADALFLQLFIRD